MKNEMEEIDIMIKESLSIEEAKFYDSLDEQNIFEMLFGLFKGKNAWIHIIVNVSTLLLFIAFVYSMIQFFCAETIDELIKWGIGSLLFIFSTSMMKLYSFMQMDKNALLREMKRLELQILSLSAKIEK